MTVSNTTAQMDKVAQLMEQDLASRVFKEGSLVTGVVLSVDAYVDLEIAGLKSGYARLPVEEFKTVEGDCEVKVGDEVELVLECIDNGQGYSDVSREKARKQRAWHRLLDAFEEGTIVEGMIQDRVKGGFAVDLGGIRAFLPGSLVDVYPVKDISEFENKVLQFKIVKMVENRNNIVVSRKAVLEEVNSEERDQLLATLEEGQEVRGIVKNLTDYGAFVDLRGIDGLLHITDMSWSRVRRPEDVVKVGQEITVKVLSFDRKEKNRISLGLKQLVNDPWGNLADRYPLKTRAFGKVTSITDYGCFVEIDDGVEGLVHMSEMDWTNKNVHPSKVVELGQEIEVMILDIDMKRRRISLGVKQCLVNPWDNFSQQFTVDQTIKGVVKSITDFGVFIGLDGGIDGLVHMTDLSWTEPGEKVIRDFKKGNEYEAKILSIDSDRERISLGIKQMTEDPMPAFFSKHALGDAIEGTVDSVDSKRVIVKLAEDGFYGSIRNAGFDTEPKEGDAITAYLEGLEAKGVFVPLSSTILSDADIKAAEASSEQAAQTKSARSAPTKPAKQEEAPTTTLGDLMKQSMESGEDK